MCERLPINILKKIIIISYFFPPCNLTASQRAFSWAKYLSKFGFYPTIITRRWDHPIHKLSDVSKGTATEIIHEKNETYEVYYLPYKPNLRDRIYVQYGESGMSFIRRFLTLIEMVLSNVCNKVIPFNNLYTFAENLISNGNSYKALIISGNPFIQFKFGYLLNKKHKIHWIADYRDAWTTSEINNINQNSVFKGLHFLERYFEKKWVSTATAITASSSPIAKGIQELTGIKGNELYNGFEAGDFKTITERKPFETFTITYVGTLYEGQKIEVFCNAFKQFIDSNANCRAKLLFPGISFYKEQEARIQNLMKGYETYYECTERRSRQHILEMEVKSHILLHVAWQGYSGIIASKIYEYIGSGSFILVTPSDKGSIEEILTRSGCGLSSNTVEETVKILQKKYADFLQHISDKNDTEIENIKQFSREYQTKILAEIISSISI